MEREMNLWKCDHKEDHSFYFSSTLPFSVSPSLSDSLALFFSFFCLLYFFSPLLIEKPSPYSEEEI